MKKLLLLIITLTACARVQVVRDPELSAYLEVIESYYGKRFTGSLTFYKLNFPIVGKCTSEPYAIQIDPYFWITATESRKFAVLLHEYGHCVKKLRHNDEVFADNCPVSIMSTNLILTQCYEKHKDYYWQTL